MGQGPSSHGGSDADSQVGTPAKLLVPAGDRIRGPEADGDFKLWRSTSALLQPGHLLHLPKGCLNQSTFELPITDAALQL